MLPLWMLALAVNGFISSKPNLIYSCFLHFKAQAELQLNAKLLVFQSDWDGEYRRLTSFLDQHGVLFRQTCPYTSKQIGIVERKHKHIVETGFTLFADSGLPLHIELKPSPQLFISSIGCPYQF